MIILADDFWGASNGDISVNTWTRLHPITQWFYYMVALIFGMLLFHPLNLVVGLLVLILVHFCAFWQFRLGNWAKVACVITLLFTMINPVFSHQGTHMFSFFSYRILWEPVVYGITWGLSLSSILLVFRMLQDFFPAAYFLAIFYRLSPQWSLLVMLSLRFVPMLMRRFGKIKLSQSFRNYGTSSSWRGRFESAQIRLLTLVSWSLEDALQMVDAIKARGYGQKKRSYFYPHRFTRRDRVVCAGILLFTIAQLYLWFLGYGRLQIYPELEPISPTLTGWLSVGLECIMLATPIWYEGGERLRWCIWKWKMQHLPTQKRQLHL